MAGRAQPHADDAALTYEQMKKKLFRHEHRNVWFIVIEMDRGLESYVTAFSFSKDKILAPTYNVDWNEAVKITGHRLNEVENDVEFAVADLQPQLHLAMLQIKKGAKNDTFVKLSEKGLLEMGERIWGITNNGLADGWCLTGSSGYKCEDVFDLTSSNYDITSDTRCVDYVPLDYVDPPPYRMIGDYCNKKTVKDFHEDAMHLSPYLPLVQCNNFCYDDCLAPGGPVYNGKREVVGMMCMSKRPHMMALHVSLLRYFVELSDA